MNDIIRRSDAKAVILDKACCGYIEDVKQEEALKWFDAIPAVDVVEVVRCKDCVHYIKFGDFVALKKCDHDGKYRRENDYCSYGEREATK